MINFSKRWSIAAIALAIVVSMASLPLTSCDNGGGGSETVATPTASPPAGTYSTAQNVSLSTTTAGAAIHYTTDGASPTTASTLYSSPITISATTTVKAIAFKEGMNSSGVLTATYTISGGGGITLVSINVTTPPPQNEYNIGDSLDTTGMVVTATYSDDSTAVVTGYTISGFDSTTAGNKPITVTYEGKTAVFYVNVINPELETVATPTASPEAGTYATAQNVALATTTLEAVIRYTTDGTSPTTASTLYSTPITISATTTVKAIAVKEGMNSSGVLEALYIIAVAPVITTPSLPNGNVGIAYSQQLTATGDTPITWSLTGTLPTGLNLSPAGVISGTPTAEGTSAITVKATNSAGDDTKSLSIVIDPPPAFNSINDFATWLAVQPPNTTASAYNVKLNVSSLGGNAITAGSLGKALADNDGKYVSLNLSGSNITTIPDYTFNTGAPSFTGVPTLTGITIPAIVTNIGISAFRGCANLNLLIIPDSVTNIGNYAFSGCSKLGTVQIGIGVTIIGEGAFTNCSGLTTINVATSNANYSSSMEGVLYNKAQTSLVVYPAGKDGATFPIPASVTSIGKDAFRDNDKITSITIRGTVTNIDERAFLYCVFLTSVTFEGAATAINNNSFEGGASLPTAYTIGGIGTYTRSGNGSSDPYTWAKQ